MGRAKTSKVNDNATRRPKAQLRAKSLLQLAQRGITPIVLETHGGWGHMYADCYTHIAQGLVCEKNPQKAEKLMRQRGHKWGVFETDVNKALAAGLGNHLEVNFLDVDPYGDPWPTIDAFLESERTLPPVLLVAVNDGLRFLAQRQRGWTSKTLEPIVRKYGNSALYERWHDICKEMFAERAQNAGYRVEGWTCYSPERSDYYSGHITHWAGLLLR